MIPTQQPYTPTCPQCFHPWARHRATSSVRVTPLDAKPLQRIRLACDSCSCYGQQLPPPAFAASLRRQPADGRQKEEA